MSKLLDKPFKIFTFYAFIVLLCSIPVYYLIIDFIWLKELDEHNHLVSQATQRNLKDLHINTNQLRESMLLWNKLHPETRIEETTTVSPDSTYNIYRQNRYTTSKGLDRFQGLVSTFTIGDKVYKITVETNVEETHETMLAITLVTVLFFIILLVGFVLLNKRIAAKLWRPFYQSLQKIKAFDLNSGTNLEFEQSDIQEFEEMNNSISKLIDCNIAVFKQQKEFTENAAHELQTPLAVVQSKLDLMEQEENISPRQSVIINDMHKALSRVSRINKNLLLLAKIENRQFHDKETIVLADALNEVLELVADFAAGQELEILKTLDTTQTINGNRMLIEIMLTNLLMNAIRHNAGKSMIHVQILKGQLQISNSGTQSLIKDKLFKRFSTASAYTPGSGLGLAIVREICNRYGWRISYEFSADRHIFTIDFSQ